MRLSEKQKERRREKKKSTEALHLLFKEIWDEREDEGGYCYCLETGRAMHGSTFRSNTCCYHHLLSKAKFPLFALRRENIVILHPDVHAQVERDISRCPKVEAAREEIVITLIDKCR